MSAATAKAKLRRSRAFCDSDLQPASENGLQPASENGLQPASENGLPPAPEDGLPPASEDDQGPKTACSQEISPAEFLQKYSSERRLIPLNRLGVHRINRKGKPLNGAQVLSLMMRFRKGSRGGGEDFQNYRYSPARVVEPDPQDPHATLRHTNNMAAIDHRIRPVADPSNKGLFGLFSKSHLWSAVWGMTGRCVKESLDPDAPTLAPPTDQPDFAFTEENGLWCEVVSWKGACSHPKVLEQLMRSENFDAAIGLPEDEVTFLDDIHSLVTSGVDMKVGEREFDAVLRTILAVPGQTHTKADVEPRYNLAKVIGRIHMDFLSRYCTLWVDFRSITIPNKALQALTKLPPTCPWLKICLLCDNYLTAEPKTRVGGKGIADNWGTGQIEEIVNNASPEELEAMEAMPPAFLDTYSQAQIPNCSAELIYKTQCKLIQRVGLVLRKEQQRSEWRAELARYESSLRKKFVDAELPPPVLQPVPPPAKKNQNAACSHQKEVVSVVDESPALQFDENGHVKTDMACKARQAGLAVGSDCEAVKAFKGVKRSRIGKVTSLGETDLTVTFGADDEAGLAEVTVSCPLTAVKATQIKKAKKDTAAEGLQPAPNGIEWKSYDEAAIENAVSHQAMAFAEQLRIAQSPTQSEVAILEEEDIMVVKKVMQPLALKIIPRIPDLRLAATTDDVDIAGDDVAITVAFAGKAARFTALGSEDYESRMDGTTWIIDPFAFIKASSDRARTYGGGCVELKRVCSGGLSVPLSEYTTTDANLRPSKKSQTRLECKISYWTNETAVPMGCALALTR